MGEWACQLDILETLSWERELTAETIPISIGGPQPQLLHSEVLTIFSNRNILVYNMVCQTTYYFVIVMDSVCTKYSIVSSDVVCVLTLTIGMS